LNIVKLALKKILPAPFLKEAFLVYNKIKILSIDKLLFPEFKIKSTEFLLYRKGHPFRELSISLDDLPDDRVKNYMQNWYDWTQEEFILVFDRPCRIESEFGWAIVARFKLIYYSLGVSRTWFQPKPGFMKLIRNKKIIQADKVISLRDSGEENYFHFFNDVLCKLYFLQLHKIDLASHSIVISKRLWDKPYFQFIIENSAFLKSLKWLVQDDQFIQCNAAIFCKPLTHRLDLWSATLLPLKIYASSPGKNNKIFLTRDKLRLRFIENSDQIEAISRKFGFTVVDTDTLSPKQQIELFSSAQFIIGIHGAGLTNMVFRQGDCRLLELFPPADLGYLPYHYIMLAKMSGFRYNGLIGERGRIKYSGGFYIEPTHFEATVAGFFLTKAHFSRLR
jgi:hypothetical protein